MDANGRVASLISCLTDALGLALFGLCRLVRECTMFGFVWLVLTGVLGVVCRFTYSWSILVERCTLNS